MRLIFRDLRVGSVLFTSNLHVSVNSIQAGWKCSMLNNNLHSLPHSSIFIRSSYRITHISTRQFAFSHSIGKKRMLKPKEEEEDEEIDAKEVEQDKKAKANNPQEDLDEDGLPIDYKTMEFVLLSRRLDHILAAVTKMSRTSIQKLILQGLVRVNDSAKTKRAFEVNEGADLQLFVEPVAENNKLALVKRICVMRCPFVVDIGYKFEVRVWREYYTDNWKVINRKKEKWTEGEE